MAVERTQDTPSNAAIAEAEKPKGKEYRELYDNDPKVKKDHDDEQKRRRERMSSPQNMRGIGETDTKGNIRSTPERAGEANSRPKRYSEGGAVEEKEVKDIDADSIIDAFLEENPDLVDTPVEEWPKEAIDMLKETFNSENIDAPNGVLPDEEDEEGEPSKPDEGAGDFEAPDADMDFDIAELAKLVQEGDKDGAWDILQNMFGVSTAEQPAPTNALDRVSADSEDSGGTSGGGNALAKLIAGLKF